MKHLIAGALIIAAFAALSSTFDIKPASAQRATYQLTVRNITARQPFSPPIVVVHDRNAVLLPSTAGRLDGLEEFAESGSQPALMESLRGRSGVKSVTRFGGIIDPKTQQTLLRVEAEPGDHVSVMSMLLCTNDAITIGTAIVSDAMSAAHGSGVVWDVGTEDNDESRTNVPCLDGEGVSNADTADGEGEIQPHPGIAVTGDLGAVFDWETTVMEIVVDHRGAQPRRSFDVGATLENRTKGQPITSPVVVVHDKNVDVITYTRPRELPGIANLSENGDGAELLATLASRPGVVSVTQWRTAGPIVPGSSYSGNARAFVGNTITVLGMFACTNDGYVVASAEVEGSSVSVSSTSAIAKVFDSGSENNDETAETVPCLGGASAGLSEGAGENGRREHPGISGVGDLNVATHGWDVATTAILSLHNSVEVAPLPVPEDTPEPSPDPSPGPEPGENQGPPADETTPTVDEEVPPDTGGQPLPLAWAFAALLGGLVVIVAGSLIYRRARHRRKGLRS